MRVANVFHAGDGNLHPLILYDANKPGELEKAEEFGADILRLCVKVGGVLTGEHGVGVEKRDLMGEMFNRDRPRPADAGQSAPSTRTTCSTPARCSRSFAAAPNSAACMSRGGKLPFPEHPEVLSAAHDHLPALHRRRCRHRHAVGDLGETRR